MGRLNELISALKKTSKAIYASRQLKSPKYPQIVTESEKIPLIDGYMYHTWNDGFPGYIKTWPNGTKHLVNREYGKGAVTIKDGVYKSLNKPYLGNPDRLWWDVDGHNRGQHVLVTKESEGIPVVENQETLGISNDDGLYYPGYRITNPIEVNKTIRFDKDPISGTYVPSVSGHIVTNKTPIEDLLRLVYENGGKIKKRCKK